MVKSKVLLPPAILMLTLPVAIAVPPLVTTKPVVLSAPEPPNVTKSAALRLILAVFPVQVTVLLTRFAPARIEPPTLIILPVTLILLLSAPLKRRTPELRLTVPVPLMVRLPILDKSKPCC